MNEDLKKAVYTNDKNEQAKVYEEYVKQVTPTKSLPLNMLKAFIIGGLICCLGQFITNLIASSGVSEDDTAAWTNVILIGISVILTGFGLYKKLGEFAGAGSLVPITGFANSVASSAIEFKKEGQVFGIGCKIFTIAGPVILYGILSSFILGVIYVILKISGVV
ncbi:MAG: stage V sporulation protein AC [Lachnospiraceae bacterium]|nr:stage V sporulation protein AC [Lachnospiraceae bacterium]